MHTHLDWDYDELMNVDLSDIDTIITELHEQAAIYGYSLTWDQLEDEAARIYDDMLQVPDDVPTIYIPGYGYEYL